jgi:cytochrome c oxidase subunit 1
MIYVVWSLKYAPRAASNPWGVKGLEWEIASPPITSNFIVTPIVTEGAYAYAEKEPGLV